MIFSSFGRIFFQRRYCFRPLSQLHWHESQKQDAEARGTMSPRQITSRAINTRLPHSPVLSRIFLDLKSFFLFVYDDTNRD
ncbi:MAG: hypothetical protein CMO60_08870 [Verrucomicrobiales bacterium]|nr:hypothetical protein [Verrucomicrobiales bacterium]